jgi:Toprim domain
MISAADLARRLARDAEAVCRYYLSKGRRSGRYWIIGDVQNTPGRSLYVRLQGPDYGPGAAGKWTDAATGEHGDLLDLIARNRDLHRLGDAMIEARGFLRLPSAAANTRRALPAPMGSGEAARRLSHAGRPIRGTLAEAYLRARGITGPLDWPALRYNPSVYYRAADDAPREVWPALLAAVTDLNGVITGILRTWLDRSRPSKAPLADPRRALGHLLGNAVRFGTPAGILAAGEGIETMLALKSALPLLPMAAGLSANHLAAIELPPALRRLYIARDNDAAGRHAADRLRERAADIDVRELIPVHNDFNLDLCRLGTDAMRSLLAHQLAHPTAGDFCPKIVDEMRRFEADR